jgi:hypothetical protein
MSKVKVHVATNPELKEELAECCASELSLRQAIAVLEVDLHAEQRALRELKLRKPPRV